VREFEPEIALRGGQDGLDLSRPIIAGASKVLKQGGWLALEIQYDQADVITALLGEAGLSFVAVHQDHEAHDRVIIARRL
jgi:release factor glutamine methyltransferase